MRIALIANATSGKGRAKPLVAELAALLAERGHALTTSWVPGPVSTEPADLLLIAGGDGTLHHSLPLALTLNCPLYHIPLGTENLLAREFRMSRRPAAILDAIDRFQTTRIDVGECNAAPFLLMCSVGCDASIIHRVQACRKGPISHLTYIRPCLAEIMRPTLRPLTIIADGATILDHAPGVAVVANCRQYGFRVDPGLRASLTDGLLDVVFFPARSSLRVLGWVALAKARLHIRRRALLYKTARDVRIRLEPADRRFQMDGEARGLPDSGPEELLIRVLPAALSILLPPQPLKGRH